MSTLYKLGPLQLDPEARVLTHEGVAVALGARAVAVLAALVSRANEYVPKSAILDAAWPGVVVEEANLAVQISAIRRVLARVPGGEGWIETLARRGYRFVGPVAAVAGRSVARVVADRKRNNLPALLTSFVGRERELAELKQLLPTIRLLTLTGAGGIGKTRLAQQAAAEMLDAYRDGVWFVDLAPLVDPALVTSALAQVLQVKEAAGQPLLAVLCNHLRTKEMLLILDNCEHVLDACARLTEVLLRETAQVTLIATSREPLHLAGERAYALGALPLPDPKADLASIARSDAVQLFVERARQQRPHFDLLEQRAQGVAEICVRLDGIALALELAAARVAVLPVEQIVRLLDQRFRLLTSRSRELPRHQTLRAMIDWSYELLDEAEKALFARLSVFAGGWTLGAAEAICGGEPIAKDEVVYVLIGLIEQSLVIADEDGDRYRMLETVREYAKEKLVASGDADAVRNRHFDCFLAMAVTLEPKLKGADQVMWLHRFDQEHDNLRAALQWSLVAAGTGEGLRLCGALGPFWMIRGYYAEGREWCARVLSKSGAELRTRERANGLQAVASLSGLQGDYHSARAWHAESLQIRRELGDRRGVAYSLNNLGIIAYFLADYTAARALYDEALSIQRELGDQYGIANTLGNLGLVACAQNDFAAARAYLEEGLAIVRATGNPSVIAGMLGGLGTVALGQGDFPTARSLFEEALAISRGLGDRPFIASALCDLGDLTCEQGDYRAAATLHRESLVIHQALGDRRGISRSLHALAVVVAALGDAINATRILGAADQIRADLGSPLEPRERASYDRHIDATRASIGDDATFDRAWAEGCALTLEQAIQLALEETASSTRFCGAG